MVSSAYHIVLEIMDVSRKVLTVLIFLVEDLWQPDAISVDFCKKRREKLVHWFIDVLQKKFCEKTLVSNLVKH